MLDTLIWFLLSRNPTGWRAHALMLKQSTDTGVPYLAGNPSVIEAIKNTGNTGLLDRFTALFWEISKRSDTNDELATQVGRWLSKDGDALVILEQMKSSVIAYRTKKERCK